ncbi:MAG: NAD-dependent epimerase/dehydratase family protein [Aequoribacter sp.]|uniref:NAD-dependent epimerase/dehydratase family protein n=1 Tax=Aequoribacter sp. TaxID=2847771 RepID=UPI003C3A2792
MKVGVVGSEGFLGTNLISGFGENDELKRFDITGSSDGSVTKIDVARTIRPETFEGLEVLVNLAAVHRDDVRPITLYHEVNVQGAINICNAARASGVRTIIFTSSVAVYGFAPADTGEDGEPNFFNEYGKTKFHAEQVYQEWQAEDTKNRCLVIVRPTVIFGPGNRGNVYNLLQQVASGRFVMFGDGRNVKSMAYVENVAKFLVQCTGEKPGVHIYNYVDKPDLSMNQLVQVARKTLFGKSGVGLRLPAFLGVFVGVGFDMLAWLARRPLPISSIRVKKFMSTTQFSSAVPATRFEAPYTLAEGLEKTLRYEFLEDNRDKPTYETE